MAAKRKERLLRKLPSQDRSKETVRAIVDATERVLTKEGADGVNTTAVAKIAGVSVGTLYQYFPTREALLFAVEERTWSALAQRMVERNAELAHEPLPRIVEELVELAVREIGAAVQRHGTVLLVHTPEPLRASRYQLMESVIDGIEAGLAARRAIVRPPDLRLAAHLVLKSVVAMGRLGAEQHPDELASGVWGREVARMVTTYLLATPP